MRSIHKWPSEKARNVTGRHGLRMPYQWVGEKPVRRKSVKKEVKKNEGNLEVTKKQYGDYHKLKCCPVQGCLTVTLKLSAHLKGLHKMKVDSEYYDLLKNARIYTPFTKDSMKRIRESHKRDSQGTNLVFLLLHFTI